MVGSACHDQDLPSLSPGLVDDLLALGADVLLVGLIGCVGRIRRRSGLGLGDTELIQEVVGRPLGKVLWPMQAEEGGQIAHALLLQLRHVGPQQFGIVGYHRAVVVVVPGMLVEVVGHAGIKDGGAALFQQTDDVPVHELGRIADRGGGDGGLTPAVQPPGAFLGQHHLKAQSGEKGVPEGEVFVHVQSEGQADLAPLAAAARELAQLFVFVFRQIGQGLRALPQGLLAPVAGQVPAAGIKGVDGQGAVVGAAAAGGGIGLVGEVGQLLGGEDAGLV